MEVVESVFVIIQESASDIWLQTVRKNDFCCNTMAIVFVRCRDCSSFLTLYSDWEFKDPLTASFVTMFIGLKNYLELILGRYLFLKSPLTLANTAGVDETPLAWPVEPRNIFFVSPAPSKCCKVSTVFI